MSMTVEHFSEGIDKVSDKFVRNAWTDRLVRRSSIEEVEIVFAQGTALTMRKLADVDTRFPRPWVFFRMLCCSVLLYIAFVVVGMLFPNPKLIPAQFFIGSVAVPISFLCLFFELNILCNVSIFRVSRFVLIGGMLSLLYSLVIYEFKDTTDSIFWAGPVEEVGKLMAMIVIAEGSMRLKTSHIIGILGMPFDWLIGRGVAPINKYPWILNGILFGASVGAGFAVFETMGYAFESLLLNGGIHAMYQTIFMRGVLSPFSHIVWSAICGGAIWGVCDGGQWRWSKLFHIKVVFMVTIAAVLHGLWDVACFDPNAIWWILSTGIISWCIVLYQIRAGVRQVCVKKQEIEIAKKENAVSCPYCGCSYDYNPEWIDRKVQCGVCNGKFIFR